MGWQSRGAIPISHLTHKIYLSYFPGEISNYGKSRHLLVSALWAIQWLATFRLTVMTLLFITAPQQKLKNGQASTAGNFADTPAKAVAGADFVFSCVGNDDDLRSVVYGDDGILAGMAGSGIYCDHTTASAIVAREIKRKV